MPVIRSQNLTKTIVETVKPKASPYRLWDSRVPGLALRVLKSGRSTFEVHWGRNRSEAIGTNGAMTLEAARVAARRILGEVDAHGSPLGHAGDQSQMRFGTYLAERYGPYVEAVNKSGCAAHAALKAQFGGWNSKLLSTITKADFDSFKVQRLRDGIHPATVNRDLDRIKAALSMAVEWKILTTGNPLLGVKRIKKGIGERVRFLSDKEEISLRKALADREAKAKKERSTANSWRKARRMELLPAISGYSDHLMPISLLALNTGLRRGELTQLTWGDIDMSGKILSVQAAYAKSGKVRHVPLNVEAMQVLKCYRKQQSGNGRLFALTQFSKSWNAVTLAAKIENFRFHDLRHTFASNLVMGGTDLNSVRELMGHSDIKMTLRYSHLAPEHKAAAVESLVARRKQSKPKQARSR